MSYTPTNRESLILEALLARLRASLGVIGRTESQVAWPDYPFEEPNDRKYLRVQFMPNETLRQLIDSDGPHQHLGIFQVTVSWPVDSGQLEARDMAGRVADAFAADTKMVYSGVVVRSVKRPTVAPSMPDGADLLTPVSVEYESYI